MAYVSKKSSCLQGEFIDVGLSLYETEAAIQAVGGFAFGAPARDRDEKYGQS